MSNFVTVSDAPPAQAEPPIGGTNGDFWPAIDRVALRKAARIPESVSAEQLEAAILAALVTLDNDLSSWADDQIAAGHATLAAVPARQIAGQNRNVIVFERAVGALVKAELLEKRRDVDTTGHGDRRADATDPALAELRREATYAVRDILGVGRTAVELI